MRILSFDKFSTNGTGKWIFGFSEKGGVHDARFTFRSTTSEDHKIVDFILLQGVTKFFFCGSYTREGHLEINDQKRSFCHDFMHSFNVVSIHSTARQI